MADQQKNGDQKKDENQKKGRIRKGGKRSYLFFPFQEIWDEAPETWLADMALRVLTCIVLGAWGVYAFGEFLSSGSWPARTAPLGGWLFALFALFYRSIVKIPAVYYGNCHVFGKRIGVTFEEGLNWRSWWWEVKQFSAAKRTEKIRESFTSKDKVEITFTGVIQYYPDLELLSTTFETLTESAIKEGLVAIIQEKLGEIVSYYNYKDIANRRTEISFLINCALRLGREPQLDLERFTEKLKDYHQEGRANELKETDFAEGGMLHLGGMQERIKKYKKEKDPEKDPEEVPEEVLTAGEVGIHPKYWLNFFDEYQRYIRILLRLEEEEPEERSRVERDFAIDIDRFSLADIAWTEKFRDTIEREQQAKAEASAATRKGEAVLHMTNKIRNDIEKKEEGEKKITQQVALQAAMAILDLSKHQTIAIDGGGGGGVMPIPIITSQPKGGN